MLPAGAKLSTVSRVVAENYGTYHEVAVRLTGLQSWVRAQRALVPGGFGGFGTLTDAFVGLRLAR